LRLQFFGDPLLPPLLHQKSNFHLWCDFAEFWKTKFSCLPIIIEIQIYKWGSSCRRRPPKVINKVILSYGPILMKIIIKSISNGFINNDYNTSHTKQWLLAFASRDQHEVVQGETCNNYYSNFMSIIFFLISENL